ncbi:MAG TPA: hypothetical protein VKX49_13250 [Bryobacteraceae bacterium]|nr:hypothetical protein [Bryobacteraceae bacterium]
MYRHQLRHYLTRILLVLLASAAGLMAAVRLYMKDGSYQIVREYQVQGDRVRFYSTDRDDWEEVPASLVDLDKTHGEIKAREEETKANAAANAAEEKAELEAQKEVERIPQQNGVYLIEENKLTPIKPAEAKVVTDKKRTILKLMSPVPLVSGKATLELDGGHAATGTANREPEFYIRLENDERFGIVRLSEHKGNRIVEKITIIPVTKEAMEQPDLVDTFRKQEADGLFKIWPEKPMPPGEYAVVEYTEGKVNMRVWDFFIAPGAAK